MAEGKSVKLWKGLQKGEIRTFPSPLTSRKGAANDELSEILPDIKESSDIKKGYIKPKFTQIQLRVDKSVDLPDINKNLMFADIYEEAHHVPDVNSQCDYDIDDDVSESLETKF